MTLNDHTLALKENFVGHRSALLTGCLQTGHTREQAPLPPHHPKFTF